VGPPTLADFPVLWQRPIADTGLGA